MQKLAAVTMTLILAACGGGGAPSASASLTLSLDGTAATGAAIGTSAESPLKGRDGLAIR